MKVISLNIGTRKTILYHGREVETGIFKYPVDHSIFLGTSDVELDMVVDRKHHGGVDKACYLYGANHYPFWEEKYPDADWTFGAFGENITLDSIDETQIHVGSTYQLGEAIVQIASSRQPCFKLGIRIGSPMIVRDFAYTSHSGIYLKVIQEGNVNKGDEMIPKNIKQQNITLAQLHSLFSSEGDNKALGIIAYQTSELAESFKADLKKQFKL